MTRVPIVTFSTGCDSAVEIDSEVFRAAERALLAEQRQARDPAAEARTEPNPAKKADRIFVGLLGGRASGWFA